MLPSGAHVKLGSYEFFLDEKQTPPYRHSFDSLLAQRTDISGVPGAQNLNPQVLPWITTDWLGGEGNFFVDSGDPSVYYISSANTRVPGKVKGSPTRADFTTAATNYTADPDI